MIGPSRLIRLSVLVGLGLLVRAIVRESEEHRARAPELLPPPTLKARKRKHLA